MIRIRNDKTINQERAPLKEVLGYESSGSAHGSSFWKRLRGCPREEKLYKIGLRKTRVVNDSLDFGSLYHLALEHYYRAKMEGKSMRDCIEAAWKPLDPVREASGYEDMYADLDKMLTGYFEYSEDDQWIIIAVEVEVEGFVTLPDGSKEPYTARLDLVVIDRLSGELRVIEHKTAKHYTEDLVIGYEADMQMLGQTWLMLQNRSPLLPRLGGVTVNICVKPQKSKPAQYMRVDVRPTQYHLNEFETSLVQWAQIAQKMAEVGHPKALGSCSGPIHYFKQCTYFNLCHQNAHFNPLAAFEAEDVPYGYELIEQTTTKP